MSANKPKLALIGAGNMGSALVSGLIAQGYPAQQIWACDPSSEKRQELSKNFSISATEDNKIAITQAQAIIFAVKPQTLIPLLKELASAIQAQKSLVISIAAGISETQMQDALGGKSLSSVACPIRQP